MKISVLLVSGFLPETTIGGGTVIVDVWVLSDCSRKYTFVDIASWEVGFPEVRSLIAVVQLELKRFCNLIVFVVASWGANLSLLWEVNDGHYAHQKSQGKDGALCASRCTQPQPRRVSGRNHMQGTSKVRKQSRTRTEKKLTWPQPNMKSCHTRTNRHWLAFFLI